jgi:hypothetical protein
MNRELALKIVLAVVGLLFIAAGGRDSSDRGSRQSKEATMHTPVIAK